jgi:hypothetical protein
MAHSQPSFKKLKVVDEPHSISKGDGDNMKFVD